jgi:hypothetical protein
MIGSLILCTILYIAIAAVLTGMVPYARLGTGDPLAEAFSIMNVNWAAGIISFGAVVAMAAVLLVFQLGQPRIFFSMSRDGLLPAWFSGVHRKFKTPYITTIMTGIFVAFFAAFANINEVVELCNIGTLFAFVLVCLGVILLRVKDPSRPRPFRCPAVPLIPILGMLACILLMCMLPLLTWIRFVYWLLIGLFIYFFYGVRHSRMQDDKPGFLQSVKSHLPVIVPLIIIFIAFTWYIVSFLGTSMHAYHRITGAMLQPDGRAALARHISREYHNADEGVTILLDEISRNGGKELSLVKKPSPGLDKTDFLLKEAEGEEHIKLSLELTPLGWKITKIERELPKK